MVFYVFVIFAPPDFVSKGANWGLLIAVLFLTVTGLSGVRLVIDYYHKDDTKNARWKAGIRWLVLFSLLGIDVALFSEIAADLVDMISHGGFSFFIIVMLGVIFANRIMRAHGRTDLYEVRIAVIGTGIVGAFYYLSVLSFALFVFPYPGDQGWRRLSIWR